MIRKLLLLPILALSIAFAQEAKPAPTDTTYTLKRSAKAGDKIEYKLTVKASVQGIDGVLKGTAVDEVKKFEDAAYTIAEHWTDSKIEVDGQESDGPEMDFSLTYAPTGELKTIAGGENLDEQYKTWFVLYDSMRSLRLPDKAVKVGDTWEAKITPVTANGNIGVDLKYALDSTETVGGIDSLKIKLVAKQTNGGTANSEMTLWVSKADASIVKIDGTIFQLTFPDLPVPVDAKYTLERITASK